MKNTIVRSLFSVIVLAIFITFPATAQQALSEEYAYKIKSEAFQNSKIQEISEYMTDFLGPRLAASKLGERAELLAVEKLKELGFENARIEFAADFPRGGWDNKKTYVAMTEPYYTSFAANPKAWSASTDGLISGEVILVNITTLEQIEQYRGKLKGKIIIMPVTREYEMRFTPYASRLTDEQLDELAMDPRPRGRGGAMRGVYADMSQYQVQQKIREFITNEEPALIISDGGVFNVVSSTGSSYRGGDQKPIAEVVLPAEAHGRIVRMINRKIPVSIEADIKNEYYDNFVINNVIAEIPGSDPKLKDEVVLIGGHLDSWHGGTGAADNASGCIVMMEALRIIKDSGIKPRRTIRVALWGGEEQGLYGSRGYLQNRLFDTQEYKAKKEFNQFALYLNMDNGSGKFRGIYLEENDMAVPFMKEWIKALESLGFSTLTLRRTGGTDHQSFDRYGLPAYQFIQDPLEYSRTYHTKDRKSTRLNSSH